MVLAEIHFQNTHSSLMLCAFNEVENNEVENNEEHMNSFVGGRFQN
jgi:hypothetical protein